MYINCGNQLSEKGNKLLFRDKRRQLYLYDVDKECCSTLLHFCSYVQVNIKLSSYSFILSNYQRIIIK